MAGRKEDSLEKCTDKAETVVDKEDEGFCNEKQRGTLNVNDYRNKSPYRNNNQNALRMYKDIVTTLKLIQALKLTTMMTERC